MTDTVKAFLARVDRLEARYAKDKYADRWLMPREMMLALRDELKAIDKELGSVRAKERLAKRMQPNPLTQRGFKM